jgi:CDP-glycerol glycerophosphotransferase (TagB/SpsB family)
MKSLLGKFMAPIAAVFFFAARVSTSIAYRIKPKASRNNYASTSRLAVIFNGRPNFIYQLKLWLPAFELLGEPYEILLRDEDLVSHVKKLTRRPVVLVDDYSTLETNPNLKLIFYVNNAPNNSDAVKYTRYTHVQLLHGDSEKTASFNPVTSMFTKIFVSGQAAVDRYERNGVLVHPKKFVLVGRPQLGGIEVRNKVENKNPLTVLIAPTWGGSAAGETYTSLSLAPGFAKELVALGHRVVFRPHPFSHTKASDRAIIKEVHEILAADANKHVFGAAAEQDLPIAECINMCDLAISDLSGIVSDWLYSLKPYILVSMDESKASFEKRYPIALGAGVLTPGQRLEGFLEDSESKFAKRREIREYYIKNAGAKDVSELFVRETEAILGKKLGSRAK